MAVDLVPAGNFTRNEGFRPLRFVGGRCRPMLLIHPIGISQNEKFRPLRSAGRRASSVSAAFQLDISTENRRFPTFCSVQTFGVGRIPMLTGCGGGSGTGGSARPHPFGDFNSTGVLDPLLLLVCPASRRIVGAAFVSTVGFRAFSRFRRAVSALQQARCKPVLTKPACLWPLSFTPEKERVRRQHAGLFRCGRFDRLFTRYFSPCLPSPPA